ncbi:GntR family transcriptional regulator [Lactococcus hodotermopsidis]|uniref:GntR family transcriptional regulator n=1 Tax=Pseudolactococcus hodotermopsidis TaxID=2709157 RepID=A0A6A0BBZ4_9LACT|nr:GntR family transcriptional regulator [Lactococcus hodotermopsidis]GFH41938.1 GntR family transcriptional regulator [Lactococcus hodotermopsidis]
MKYTSLQEQAYETILHKIIYSDFAPGQKISEKELEKILKIGRTPIREALVQLRKQELIDVVPQSGTYISKINLKSADNARFTREQLERRVMAECITQIDEEGKKALLYIIEKQREAALSRNKRDFFFFDNIFHKTCFEIAGREEIWNWLTANSIHLDRFRWLRVAIEEMDWDGIIKQHQTIIDTILSKNIDEMDFIMTLHLHMMLDEKDFVISKYPEYFL